LGRLASGSEKVFLALPARARAVTVALLGRQARPVWRADHSCRRPVDDLEE